jgi:hypothetical protein
VSVVVIFEPIPGSDSSVVAAGAGASGVGVLEANTTTLLVMVDVAWIAVISSPSVGPDAGLLVGSAFAFAFAYGSGCVVAVVAAGVDSAPGVIKTITGVRTGV